MEPNILMILRSGNEITHYWLRGSTYSMPVKLIEEVMGTLSKKRMWIA